MASTPVFDAAKLRNFPRITAMTMPNATRSAAESLFKRSISSVSSGVLLPDSSARIIIPGEKVTRSEPVANDAKRTLFGFSPLRKILSETAMQRGNDAASCIIPQARQAKESTAK